MGYLLAVLAGYLLGCSNMAYYVGKAKHVDLTKAGSGNLGASNATTLLGWGAGVLVGAHDIGKAAMAVFLAQLLLPELPYVGAAAGVACVLGHIFPFYLKFKGGKGLASFIGMSLILNWQVTLVALVLLVLITVATQYIALGTLAVSLTVPVGIGIATHSLWVPLILAIATVVIFCKHTDNMARIREGTEIKLLSTVKGENRVK
jgi:glycerol-3-phosphate acyltransferase PlsY